MLSPASRAAWDDDGWCTLERAIPADDLAAAQRVLPRLFPTAEEMSSAPDTEPNTRWRTWDAQWPEFPFHSSSLNRLAVHDVVIGLARELLGVDEVRMYAALITAKYFGQSSGFNQLLHADYPNHMLVVPRRDVGYQQLETFIYLSDVTVRDGATRLVSRRKTAGIPVEEHTLNLRDYADLYDDPGNAAAPAGSIVAYRPDVYHRSVDLTDPGASAVHDARRLPTRRRRVGRLPGVAVQGVLAGVVEVRRPGHPRAARGARLPRAGSSVLDRRDPGRRRGPVSRARPGTVAARPPVGLDRGEGNW